MSLLKGNKEREGRGRGTRAYRRRRVLGERRRTGPLVLAGLMIFLVLAGATSVYLGAYPTVDIASLRAGFPGEDEEGVVRGADPTAVIAEAPKPPAEPVPPPAEEEEAAEADAADEPSAEQEAAVSEAARELEAQRIAAQEEEERVATETAATEAAASEEEAQEIAAQEIAAQEIAAQEEEQAAAEAVAAEDAEADAADEPSAEQEAAALETLQEEEAEATTLAAPPSDPTMYLSVPKLGISGATVAGGEAGLELGAMHLSGSGYPWQLGANTYIAGHRIGFPGTGSDHIFYNLPSIAVGDEVTLTDSLGQTYAYSVSEVFAVTPFDLWVTAPTGDDMVTLQVCTETPEDWWTIGPKLMESGPESGRLIVRAVRV